MPDAVRALPRIGILLPEGWVRLRFDDTIDRQIAELSAQLAKAVEPQRRDLARVALRRQFDELARQAAGSAFELWMPVAPTAGVNIPVTMTVAPPPAALDPERSISDHLAAFAAAGGESSLGEIGGRPAVRVTADVPGKKDPEGRWTEFPRRRVTALVAPGGEDGWLVFHGEIIVPEQDADEIVAACEFFIGAFLQTVSFPSAAPGGD
jgi:hypothetical protein